MFEVTEKEISELDDTQLRTLVARLAMAELSSKGSPISGVTAGGDQNAPDGGIDVRVEVSDNSFSGDFIPRVPLGFQVKKPKMPPKEIEKEMKPKGVLRPVIGELADASGAYIIVSSLDDVPAKPLGERQKAMHDALKDHPSADQLRLDFYDRCRLRNWVNQYLGVVAWVKERAGRPLAGWRTLGDWLGTRVGSDEQFISDSTTCLIDGRSKEQTPLTIIEGINRIRSKLAQPKQSVRLIGMSGLGKTRLVQALFENGIGDEALTLDPSLAIYTDYSETPEPSAQTLASELIQRDKRTILVIDNCSPQNHSRLTEICCQPKSKLSLITVEYDVRDDVPGQTEVFILQPASQTTVVEWIKSKFEDVSQINCERIAKFSDGNFRVARVLAEMIKKGDSLGRLEDEALFQRIFEQRHGHSDDLLNVAEILALVYSFDGEDTSSSGELALLAQIAETNTTKLYASISKLKDRSLIQSRGKWRALLPHAIANRLAARALKRIPPHQLDHFSAHLPPRMQKSLSRRLGYLHDSKEAKQIVERWLRPDGPLGDLLTTDKNKMEFQFQLLRNIAPVDPKAVLKRIEEEIEGPKGIILLDPKTTHRQTTHRQQLILLLKLLAYDSNLFDRATKVLTKFLSFESPDENHNSARNPFEELFHLYLSGTRAPPEQRRQLIQYLYERGNTDSTRCGHIALRALLKSSNFPSSLTFDFGARSMDFGWRPPTHEDVSKWYSEAINFAIAMSTDTSKRSEIRRIVSEELHGILSTMEKVYLNAIEAAIMEFLAIEAAIMEFLQDGEWIDGWQAIQEAIRFDSARWQPEFKERVLEMEIKLRPSCKLDLARAYVLGRPASKSGLLDLDDNKEQGQKYSTRFEHLTQKVKDLGREFGEQPEQLEKFLVEALQAKDASQTYSFGIGLAESSTPKKQLWEMLRTSLIRLPIEQRNPNILGGFLQRLCEIEPSLGWTILDTSLSDPHFVPYFVWLQVSAGLDFKAIERLRKAISSGHFEAHHFCELVPNDIISAPQDELAALLNELCALDNGTAIALKICHTVISYLKDHGLEVKESLLDTGHLLLLQMDYRNSDVSLDELYEKLTKNCYSSATMEQKAQEFCQHLKQKITDLKTHTFQLNPVLQNIFEALFEVQPVVALNELVSSTEMGDDDLIYSDINGCSPLEKVDPNVLWQWADQDPKLRYPRIGRYLNIFAEDNDISSLFREGLERSPDRSAFLARNRKRLSPNCWSDPLSTILDRRHTSLQTLANHSDPATRSWISEQTKELATLAEKAREQEVQENEGSFE